MYEYKIGDVVTTPTARMGHVTSVRGDLVRIRWAGGGWEWFGRRTEWFAPLGSDRAIALHFPKGRT